MLIERDLPGRNPKDGWSGHYNVITGYDDDREVYIVQDTYPGIPNAINSYERVNGIGAFNYIYIIIYTRARK